MTIEKPIKIYNNRQQIHLNKADDYHDDTAVIYTPDEHRNIGLKIQQLEIDIKKLNKTLTSKEHQIKELTDNQDAAIKEYQQSLKDDYYSKIDEYQSKIDDYHSKIESKDAVINDLKAALIDISSKYNMLRLAIADTSRLSVLFNGHKDILNRYPEHHIEYDDKSILIKLPDTDDADK